MQEYERTRAEEEGVRNFLSGADLASPETRAGLMKFGKTGLGYNKALADAETATLARQKTQLEVDAKKFENQNKQLDFVWNGVGASPTPQNAIDYITQGVKDGNLSMVQGSAEVKRLQSISEDGFRKYKIEKVLGVLDAKEKFGDSPEQNAVAQRRMDELLFGSPNRMDEAWQKIAALDAFLLPIRTKLFAIAVTAKHDRSAHKLGLFCAKCCAEDALSAIDMELK
jgi:hypothetical protein